jgi:hypothetical protein
MTPLSVLRRFKYVRELERANESLRLRLAAYGSIHGAGPPGGANCDTAAVRRFAELDKDYKSLEQEYYHLRHDFSMLRVTLRRLADGA